MQFSKTLQSENVDTIILDSIHALQTLSGNLKNDRIKTSSTQVQIKGGERQKKADNTLHAYWSAPASIEKKDINSCDN